MRQLPYTLAGRIEMIRQLLHPVADDGTELDPLITSEEALKLLDFLKQEKNNGAD